MPPPPGWRCAPAHKMQKTVQSLVLSWVGNSSPTNTHVTAPVEAGARPVLISVSHVIEEHRERGNFLSDSGRVRPVAEWIWRPHAKYTLTHEINVGPNTDMGWAHLPGYDYEIKPGGAKSYTVELPAGAKIRARVLRLGGEDTVESVILTLLSDASALQNPPEHPLPPGGRYTFPF